jgi:ribosomal protein S18 acetylase RimI-like enzyme
MQISPARISDAPVLARIHVDSWRAAYRGLIPDPYLERFTYQWREESFRQSLAANAEETYLIQQNDQVVGLLTLGAARDSDVDVSRTGEIWGIYLLPNYWRKGIGKKVVQEAEAMLKSREYETIILWVLEKNQQARQFYEAMGFNPDGASRSIDWGVPLKAVRYRKVLQTNRSDR